MITFKKISEQHYEVYSYELLISHLEVHKSHYKVLNRFGSILLPLSARKCIKTLLLKFYESDLKTMKLAEYAFNEDEGKLSIKKMKKIMI
tara:strand:- start:2210 stop:2479 length:270 start_codon:yes stop_codon:yes gene_type:complete